MSADRFPSAENDKPKFPWVAETFSGPRQSCFSSPDAGSRATTPLSPSMFSVNKMRSRGHTRDAAEAFSPGVRLRLGPPAAGTKKMSPPTTPSSLIRPPINEMDLPSGDQRGDAICIPGFSSELVLPEPTSIVNSSATYQLLSPEPCAAIPARVLPSGDQSYS